MLYHGTVDLRLVVPGPTSPFQRRVADLSGKVFIDISLRVALELLHGQSHGRVRIMQRPEQLHLSKVDAGMPVVLTKENTVVLAQVLCNLIQGGAFRIAATHPDVVIEITHRRKLSDTGRFLSGRLAAGSLRQEHCRACQCDTTKFFHALKLLKSLFIGMYIFVKLKLSPRIDFREKPWALA